MAAPAGDLYVSSLFMGRRRFVEASCDRWFILSALHGGVDPDEVIEPYDESLVASRTATPPQPIDRPPAADAPTTGERPADRQRTIGDRPSSYALKVGTARVEGRHGTR
jgi:hypothetical protein